MAEEEKDGITTENIVKKGDLGERYIIKNILELGWKVMDPLDKYSIWDYKLSKDGKEIYLQIKYKEPRIHYPDTGVGLKQFEKYLKFQEESKVPYLILFTDNSGRIYGEFLDILKNNQSNKATTNSKDQYEMIYWNLEILKDYKELLR